VAAVGRVTQIIVPAGIERPSAPRRDRPGGTDVRGRDCAYKLETPDDVSPVSGDAEPNRGVTDRVKGVSPLVLTLIAALFLGVLAMEAYRLAVVTGAPTRRGG
jgi:hypothetical protein